jgi:hypothetical protein
MIEQFLQKKIADMLGEFVEVTFCLSSSKKVVSSVCKVNALPNRESNPNLCKSFLKFWECPSNSLKA